MMINWACLAISFMTAIIAAVAYRTEVNGKTHEFEKRFIAWIAFGVDLVAKTTMTIVGAILYQQFVVSNMLPALILAVFAITVIEINVYDIIKVKELHAPETDALINKVKVELIKKD
jgi:hypothetical protein